MLPYAGIGSRDITPEERDKAKAVANVLRRIGMTLYSGGADGADTAFHEGAGESAVIWIPWKSAKNRIILGRQPNYPQVKFVLCIATREKSDQDFVKGGTGQAVRIALDRAVPVFNLRYLDTMAALDQVRNVLGFDVKRRVFQHTKDEIPAEVIRACGESVCEKCGREFRYHNLHQYGGEYDFPLYLFQTCDGRLWKL